MAQVKLEDEAVKAIATDTLIALENYIFAIVNCATGNMGGDPISLSSARRSLVERFMWLKELADKE